MSKQWHVQQSTAEQLYEQTPDETVQLIWTDPPFGTDQLQVGSEHSYRDGTVADTLALIDQQTAIRAIAAALHGDACPADPDPGESCGCGDYEREAEIALTAATPHLRAETVDRLKNFRNDYQHTYAIPGDPYADGYLTACNAIIALLEGGGACCEHSKCPGGSICCCQEGGAE